MSSSITFQDQINESTSVGIVGGFRPLSATPFEQKMIGWKLLSWTQEPISDPFELSLKEFLALDYGEALNLQNEAYRRCSRLLEDAWKRGVRQAVVCEGKIVFESRDEEDIPNETVERLAKEYNKACYVFSAPDIVE